MKTTTGRVLVALSFAAAVLAGASACGPATAGSPTPEPAAAAPITETFGEAQPPAPGDSVAPTLVANFPGTVKAYSEAIVSAWKNHQVTYLGSLTTPTVQEQILEIPMPLNMAWVYLRCDGTAGSSYCTFLNDVGDEFTVRISHALLGQGHAGTDVKLDLTTYPADGLLYVKKFVGAWQIGNKPRMVKLSSLAIANQVGSAPVSPTYPTPDCCGGGLLQVRVVWGVHNVRFDVGPMKLGGPAAIVAYSGGLPIAAKT